MSIYEDRPGAASAGPASAPATLGPGAHTLLVSLVEQ